MAHPLRITREYKGQSFEGYMNEADIKVALGLPNKLPARAFTGRFTYMGTIQGVTIWDRGQEQGKRKHRLYALIKDRYVPCGRLMQYKG